MIRMLCYALVAYQPYFIGPVPDVCEIRWSSADVDSLSPPIPQFPAASEVQTCCLLRFQHECCVDNSLECRLMGPNTVSAFELVLAIRAVLRVVLSPGSDVGIGVTVAWRVLHDPKLESGLLPIT